MAATPGLARGVERRIAPLKFRKAERESFNRNRRKSPECARGDQQSESLNRKTPWPRPAPDLREARTADSNPKQILPLAAVIHYNMEPS
jgi:hypothetical protein